MADLLIIVLMGLHLVLVDLAMAGPLGCIWLEWRSTRHADSVADSVGRSLAGLTQLALLGGIASGVLLVGIYWYREDDAFFSAAGRIPVSRLWFGAFELAFSLVCMIVYGWLWRRWQSHRYLHRTLAVASASNLTIHFPALFAIISILAARGDGVDQVLDRAQYQSWLIDPEVVSRVAHVWLAAASVTAAAIMSLASRLRTPSADPLIRGGAQAALAATCLQLPVGIWLTIQLPESAREPLVGGDGIATTLFLTSLGLAMWLVQILASVAQGQCDSRIVHRAIAAMLLVVLLMTATLYRARDCAKTVSLDSTSQELKLDEFAFGCAFRRPPREYTGAFV
jgi:hypothetical protein